MELIDVCSPRLRLSKEAGLLKTVGGLAGPSTSSSARLFVCNGTVALHYEQEYCEPYFDLPLTKDSAMINRQTALGLAAAVAIALLPMSPAMANGHAFRPLHPFALGHGLLGAAVALATLPLAVASTVLSSVSESAAPYASAGYGGPAYGYAPPAPARPYYAPHPYYAAPRVNYGPRAYAAHPGYGGRGYYAPGGYPYPRR